jgi:hypothetical protein
MNVARTESNASDPWRLYRAFDLLRALHQHFNDQIKTADQKAGFILTLLTVLFAYSKDQGKILLFLDGPSSSSPAWILSLVFAAAACFSIVCTGLVFLPRIKTGTSAMFWGSWISGGIKAEQLTGPDLDDLIMSEYLKDLKNLALICQAKYLFVGLAFRGTAATILCFLAIVLLGK